MRPLISYDDIASQTPDRRQEPSGYTEGSGPPSKKRRKNNRQGHRHRSDDSKGPKRRDYGIREEQRTLTHEEVWDDSALIRAWDAAVEEYEVLNGPDKKWKTEPVNKSALWFNIPPEIDEPPASPGLSSLMPPIPTAIIEGTDKHAEPTDVENSQPVDFDTFVPRHDPTLASVIDGEQSRVSGVAAHSHVGGPTSKDEAFQRAIGAWYWAGYWTGVYHSTSSTLPDATQADEEGEDEGTNIEGAGDNVENEGEEDIVTDGSNDEAPVEQDLLPT